MCGRYLSVSFPPPPQEGPPHGPSFRQPYGTPPPTGPGWADERGRRLAQCWGDAPGVIRVATALQLLVAVLVAVDGLLGIVRGGHWLIGGASARTSTPQDGEAAMWAEALGVVIVVRAIAALLFAAVGFAAGRGLLKRRRGWWAVAVGWQLLTALVAGATSRGTISISVAAVGIAGFVVLLSPASRDHVAHR